MDSVGSGSGSSFRMGIGSSTPSLPSPCPKSPPDLYGRRRDLARLQMLEREKRFLEEELKFVEGLPPASKCCKEVVDTVRANVDPFVPTNWKSRKSCRLWKWLCGSSCFSLSWICCCTGCSVFPKVPKCCHCCSLPVCNACCNLPACNACCSLPACNACCSLPDCCSCTSCSLPKCKCSCSCNPCSCCCTKNLCSTSCCSFKPLKSLCCSNCCGFSSCKCSCPKCSCPSCSCRKCWCPKCSNLCGFSCIKNCCCCSCSCTCC